MAKAQDYRDAWFVAHLLQPYAKTPLTTKDFLAAPVQDLDDVLGLSDPAAGLDAAIVEQARRRGG